MKEHPIEILYQTVGAINHAYFDADPQLVGRGESIESSLGSSVSAALRESKGLTLLKEHDGASEESLGAALLREELLFTDQKSACIVREIGDPSLQLKVLWGRELPLEFENFGPFMPEKVVSRDALFRFHANSIRLRSKT